MELKATIKNRFGEEGDTKFDPADVNGSDSDYPEESVEEVNEQYIKGWGGGGGHGRKMQCGCDGGMG